MASPSDQRDASASTITDCAEGLTKGSRVGATSAFACTMALKLEYKKLCVFCQDRI